METDPLSDDAFYDFCDGKTRLQCWQECARRTDERYAAVEAAHTTQIQALTKRIEELENELRMEKDFAGQ